MAFYLVRKDTETEEQVMVLLSGGDLIYLDESDPDFAADMEQGILPPGWGNFAEYHGSFSAIPDDDQLDDRVPTLWLIGATDDKSWKVSGR